MGLADVAEVLWREVLKHNPADPAWSNRDRFVLSNGHGSMLLYSVLHLTGYELTIDEIKAFRQLGSKTPGHPEFRETAGVETTTGPLGQGFANAVGLAMAEQLLAREFNKPELPIVDHRTWVIVGDGCLMEGISHEAASLAGTLGLGKLVAIYDDNGISIDGETDAWFTEDVPARFEAYGWRVIRGVDGHDGDAVAAALAQVDEQSEVPTLVCTKTIIGFGSPAKQGTAGAHGAALGDVEVAAVRKTLNWSFEPFEIPQRLYAAWDGRERGTQLQQSWEDLFKNYQREYPELAAEYQRRMAGELPPDWNQGLRAFAEAAQAALEPLETRKSSQRALGAVAPDLPELYGGSADLTGSNGTRWADAPDERYFSYGVREFGMSAITNGMVLHGGLRPFTGTFLVFMEYARNAVRLAALMEIPNIFVYTHDSVAVGEDGPTHQPIEQLTNLRTTPGLHTWRPCDTVESAFAWEAAIASRREPSALIFTRQKTPAMVRDLEAFNSIARGGYILSREQGDLDVILIATGSEVGLAAEAAEQLKEDGLGVRLVSMPCTDIFLSQDADYRNDVLPVGCAARVAVEAAHSDYWYRFVGLQGAVVGISRFGVSAPGDEAMAAMGMTVENVVAAARSVLSTAED